jgi:hypothetical protein
MQICLGRHSTVATLHNWENKANWRGVYFPPVLMTHVNLVGYLSILALSHMTVSLPHLIAL